MSNAAKKIATYEDLFDLPENVVGEIIAGELIVSPRPASTHAHATSILGMYIGTPFQLGRGGPGGWWIVDEPEIHFGEHVLVPDLAGWQKDRMPAPPVNAPFYTLAPDWVCEVLSPSSARTDRVRKLPIYAHEGVRWLWLVDPRSRTIEAFRRQDSNWLLIGVHSGEERARIEPFDAVDFEIGALWVASPPVE